MQKEKQAMKQPIEIPEKAIYWYGLAERYARLNERTLADMRVYSLSVYSNRAIYDLVYEWGSGVYWNGAEWLAFDPTTPIIKQRDIAPHNVSLSPAEYSGYFYAVRREVDYKPRVLTGKPPTPEEEAAALADVGESYYERRIGPWVATSHLVAIVGEDRQYSNADRYFGDYGAEYGYRKPHLTGVSFTAQCIACGWKHVLHDVLRLYDCVLQDDTGADFGIGSGLAMLDCCEPKYYTRDAIGNYGREMMIETPIGDHVARVMIPAPTFQRVLEAAHLSRLRGELRVENGVILELLQCLKRGRYREFI